MVFENYLALISTLIALFTLARQIYISNKQSKIKTFFTYTQRYQDIVVNLPLNIKSNDFSINKLEKKEKEHLLIWLRAYFNLCSEEYYLNKKKLVDSDIWELWELGIHDSLKLIAFQDAWKELKNNEYYEKDFSNYINNMIK